jgi:phage tail sheath gpL-like
VPTPVPFKLLPANQRAPLFYAELDNSQANTATTPQRTLIIGQVTAAAIAAGTVPNVPVLSASPSDAVSVGGNGSILAIKTYVYRLNDPSGEVWYLPLADAAGATSATGSITFSGAPTAPGVLSLYIAGRLLQLPIAVAQTPAQIAAAFVTLIGQTPNIPVTAAAVAGVVTLTAVNAGLLGNDIPILLNYGGAVQGQSTPAGLTVAIVAMSGGTLVPSLTTALGNLGSKPYDFIDSPYNDAVSLASIQTFLSDQSGRWSYAQQIYGGSFTAATGTAGALTTLGGTVNDQHSSIMGVYGSPHPAWVWASAYAGACAQSLRNDPGLPLHTLTLFGVLPPPISSRFMLPQQNSLLYSGISTFNVDDSGTVSIQLAITTYQRNAFNQPDNSYLKVETLYSLMYIIRFLRADLLAKFGQSKLAADGSQIPTLGNVTTPNKIRSAQIAAYKLLCNNGYAQNFEAFAANLIVQKNATNVNRVDILWPGTLINQLDILAMLVQFRLS